MRPRYLPDWRVVPLQNRLELLDLSIDGKNTDSPVTGAGSQALSKVVALDVVLKRKLSGRKLTIMSSWCVSKASPPAIAVAADIFSQAVRLEGWN